MPKVSIVILSHRVGMLPEAFASAQQQTFKDREIVVKFSEEYWGDKLNDAIRGCSGEYFVVLCDDDKLDPTYVERTVAELERQRTDIAYTDNQVFGTVKFRHALRPFSLETLQLHCVPHFTALCKKSLWFQVGGFDGEQPYIDWDFWYRCAERGATAAYLAGEHLFWYRSTNANGSRTMDNRLALAKLKAKHPGIQASFERVRVA